MSPRAIKEIDFGFFWCRVVAFYHLRPDDLGALPLKTFWLMVENIDRIQAQSDMRALTVAAASQTPDGAQQVRERLEFEKGDIVVVDAVAARVTEALDASGLDELRDLS